MLRFVKILFTTVLLMGFAFTVFGQTNLVPNGSFEDTVQCPTPFSQIEHATGWINPNGYSPDYFHSCANFSNPYSGVPNNGYGFQNPVTGIAYGGIYLPVNAGNDLREYIQIQLIDTLVSGVKYIVRFNVSLGDSSIFSVNSLGAYFSNNAISSSDLKVFNVTPQVVNNGATNPLTDKNIWYEILDTVTAIGGENFITIGNFEFDSSTDTTSVTGGGSSPSYASYYYIDDVSVIEAFPNSINEINQTYISVFPNPSNGKINISSNKTIKNYTVHSSLGQLIINNFPNTTDFHIDLTNYSTGIYYINLQTTTSNITKKIIIN